MRYITTNIAITTAGNYEFTEISPQQMKEWLDRCSSSDTACCNQQVAMYVSLLGYNFPIKSTGICTGTITTEDEVLVVRPINQPPMFPSPFAQEMMPPIPSPNSYSDVSQFWTVGILKKTR